MSDTKSSRGQSSKGFLHWLKNTWLGKLWNWIVSCFRPEQEDTEPKLVSMEQINDEQNGQSQSYAVEQEKVSEPNQNREEVCEDVQKEGSSLSQTPVDPESLAMLRSSSEPCLNRTVLSESLANSLGRSQSLNDLSQASIDPGLKWDDSDLNSTLFQSDTSEPSPQPQQKLGSSNTEEGKGNGQNTKKEQNKPETKSTSGNNKAEDKEEHRKQVLENKQNKDRENEQKGEETLKNSEKKQKGAEERRQKANKEKSKRAKNTRSRSAGSDHSAENGNSPNSSFSGSSSSISSSNGKGH